MTFRAYVKAYLAIVLLVVVLLGAMNLAVDPYGIFNTKLLPIAVEPSTYFNKIEHLERNRGRYAGFMLGSSQIGFTPTAHVERYLPGIRVYNLWVSSATQYENLAHVKYLARNHAPKLIYIQVDVDLAMTAYRHGPSSYARKLHPAVEGGSRPLFLFEYLTIFPLERIREKIEVNAGGRVQSTLTDFANTGTVAANALETSIESDGPGYLSRTPLFNSRPGARYIHGDQTARNVRALREIREICEKQGIRLIMFTHAEHRTSMDRLALRDYLDFLGQLAEVTDYWDFSGYNSVTTSDLLYYSDGHYRPAVGRLIAARIFGDASIAVPDDFGIRVTRENFARLAETRKRQFLERDRASARPETLAAE